MCCNLEVWHNNCKLPCRGALTQDTVLANTLCEHQHVVASRDQQDEGRKRGHGPHEPRQARDERVRLQMMRVGRSACIRAGVCTLQTQALKGLRHPMCGRNQGSSQAYKFLYCCTQVWNIAPGPSSVLSCLGLNCLGLNCLWLNCTGTAPPSFIQKCPPSSASAACKYYL